MRPTAIRLEPYSNVCSNMLVSDTVLPRLWPYPAQCRNGHAWGPGLVIVGWTPCQCAEQGRGAGHQTVRCGVPGCRSVWHMPPHIPGADAS